MGSEDGAYIIHYDEWFPFWALAPESGARVDLLRFDGPTTVLAYNAVWPCAGEWQYWRRR